MRVVVLIPLLAASMVIAQAPPDYGFTWSTITHPGNPAYPGDPNPPPDTVQDLVIGRGSVNYEYRIATNELSIANWTEFVNTFAVQGDFPIELWGQPAFTRSTPLNIVTDPTYGGPGRRYRYDEWRANNPLFGGIRWRDAALFCNWLHNGKTSDPTGLWGGAYDTSTWDSDGPPYTDALTHEPDAQFWIPTQDEWMKAAFWDPAKPDRDGWWRYLNSSDLPPTPGLPGEPGATTSAGLTTGPNFNPQDIALGAYLDALSPWGLLDTASGNREWLEEPFYPGDLRDRGTYGAWAGNDPERAYITRIGGSASGNVTLRLASAVPSPASGTSITLFALCTLQRRSRKNECKPRGPVDDCLCRHCRHRRCRSSARSPNAKCRRHTDH